MAAFISVVLLLLLSGAVKYSSCERFNIVPSPDSPCPSEFTGEPCLTLQQYVANPSLSYNITLEVHPGNHHLDSYFSVSNTDSFTMRAYTPSTSATVTCDQQRSLHFYFKGLQQIHISDITFVGCIMRMDYITNATFERNSLMNRTISDNYVLSIRYSSVLISQCTFSDFYRVYYGAIYGTESTFVIEQSTFRNIYSPNSGNRGRAIDISGGNMDISNCNFSTNVVTGSGSGGAVYASSAVLTITKSYFSGNRAENDGGAIYFNGDNIIVINSTFINNAAIAGGGGAIYSAGRYTNISLINSFFSQNTAAYCGVMVVAEFYHYHVNITGNAFTYNRHISGNEGGVICIRNASVLVLDNNFSHNSAAGNAGVIHVDESDIIIKRSIFRNNTAGRNGGVLHTYFYPTRYTIINSTFTNNQAGGDGGVMYVGRAGSRVTMNQGSFSFNSATNRGGVIAIVGSTLEINRAVIFDNTAESGDVISACNSNVKFNNNPILLANQDPTYSFCLLYNNSNVTISRTTEQTMSTAAIPTDVETWTGVSTATEDHALTATSTSADSNTSTEQETTASNNVSPATDLTERDESVPTTKSSKSTNPIPTYTPEYNLHYIVPGYVAIGVSAILIVIIAFTCLLVIVKVFRVKLQLQKTDDNLNVLYDYPAT